MLFFLTGHIRLCFRKRKKKLKLKPVEFFSDSLTNFLAGFDELERNRRLYSLEVEARHGLMGDIIDTELITIRHEDGDIGEGIKYCVAEIHVGVKGGQDINEIINS